MVGTNRNEGTMFMTAFPAKTPADFLNTVSTTYSNQAERVAAFYPMQDTSEVRSGLDQFITDVWFLRNTRAMLNGMSKVSSPAYQYHFTKQSPMMPAWGAHHGAEIGYAFSTLPETSSPEDQELSRTMTSYWVNFARSGDPNGDALPTWPEYEPKGQKHLELGEQIRVGERLRADVCDELEIIRAEKYQSASSP